MRTSKTAAALAAAGALVVAAVPAHAKGGEVGGTGNEYFLSDTFSAEANTRFAYGTASDEVYVGDWDGDGDDTLALRRGAQFLVRNSNTSGGAEYTFSYGRPGDTVLIGDWDGDGVDTLAVRRGAQYHVKNSLTPGPADQVIVYGRARDIVLVGDWDGDGDDTFAVRRGAEYYVKNVIAGGGADRVAVYGRATDDVYVGDWDGDGDDTFTVRRGAQYFVTNAIRPGAADRTVVYGRASDTTLVGDWNADGVDSLGIRRGAPAPTPSPTPAPAPRPGATGFGDGTHVVGRDIAAYTYRAPGGDSCYWERLSGFGGTLDDVIANDFGARYPIVSISPTDAGFTSRGCGRWSLVASTYPASPATSFAEGTFVVGGHIQPGTYRAPGGPSCYWERLSGFSGKFDDLIANDFGPTNPVVTISATDDGFTSRDCGTWRRQ